MVLAAIALPAYGETLPGPTYFATLYAGTELSASDTRRFEAGLALRPANWTASVALSRTMFELPDEDTGSTVGNLKVIYRIGDFGVGAGVRRGEVDDLSLTRGWLVSGLYESGQWSLGGEIERRGTSLAASEFTDEQIPTLGRVSGVARCDVDSTAYGAQAYFSLSRWSGFVRFRMFDYEEFQCAISITGSVPRPLPARGRALGARLAATTLRSVTGFNPRLLSSESSLLESALALGAGYSLDDRWIVGGEFYRDVNGFGREDDSLTALVFANRRLSESLSLEAWAGYGSAAIEAAAFTGVRLTADL
jgi:hypothetical protein